MRARTSQVALWALLMPDGSIVKGKGTKPPAGWFNDVRRCVGLALRVLGHPPLYAVRPVCSHDVDQGVTGSGEHVELDRVWGVKPEPGSQVWLFTGGEKIGLGRDTNEVERLVLAFQGKVKAGEVARGPDQRDRPE